MCNKESYLRQMKTILDFLSICLTDLQYLAASLMCDVSNMDIINGTSAQICYIGTNVNVKVKHFIMLGA